MNGESGTHWLGESQSKPEANVQKGEVCLKSHFSHKITHSPELGTYIKLGFAKKSILLDCGTNSSLCGWFASSFPLLEDPARGRAVHLLHSAPWLQHLPSKRDIRVQGFWGLKLHILHAWECPGLQSRGQAGVGGMFHWSPDHNGEINVGLVEAEKGVKEILWRGAECVLLGGHGPDVLERMSQTAAPRSMAQFHHPEVFYASWSYGYLDIWPQRYS